MWYGRAARDALTVGIERHPSRLASVRMDPHHSLELGGAEQQTKHHLSVGQQALAQLLSHQSGENFGCPSAWVAGLSQHGSDWFEGVLFVSQKETAAAVRANQPPFPIQIISYPVLASQKHDFVCLEGATLKCNSQSTGKLICENFRRSMSSHGVMDNTDHTQYRVLQFTCSWSMLGKACQKKEKSKIGQGKCEQSLLLT